ncbi:MAG: TadE/TadG family type IV pilus assembly protein [Propionibacteriaceae bacterium]|nr:TadE/TadG family type IV pilus assembly protein [Propionibacteriaceae bacterium]
MNPLPFSRSRRNERGAAAVEIAILTPVVLLVVAVMVAGARVWLARAAVSDAASSGARAATLEYTAQAAQQRGRAIALDGLVDVPCATRAVTLNTSGFAIAVGQPANVTAHVTCVVDLADLVGFGIPGSITVEASAVSALDTYRRRA